MGHLLAARRRQILQKGRGMKLLRRASTNAAAKSVTLTGFPRLYRPGEIEGAIQQGDQQVEILNDELAAADYGLPALNDLLVLDGRQLTVQGSRPIYEGATLIGHSLWVRG